MRYDKIIKGKFIERPNRFIAIVEIDGDIEKVHVKNTGRCKELLVPGATVYLEDFVDRMGSRKMRYSLIGVEKETSRGNLLINMDSQAPNKAAKEALLLGNILLPGMKELVDVKGEYTYGNSRIDFYVKDQDGREGLIEVKGVTLEKDRVASFPDAPTERGIKHLMELEKAAKEGINAYALFVIQMKGAQAFTPNDERHKAFGDALRHASHNGVKILCYDCVIGVDSMKIDEQVAILL